MDEESKRWLKSVCADSGSKIEKSEVVMSLFTTNYKDNPQCALELGIAMMLDKPIAIIALDGTPIPNNIRRAAFAIETVRENNKEDMGRAMKNIGDKLAAQSAH